ncbi:MAG: MFS transporter, partial [Phycisphaeraceae bacterium]
MPAATTTPSAAPAPAGNAWQLTLATGAFAVCFAVFGSISAMMPIVRERLGLTPMQVSVAIALPVLLGSLGRIPLGMLTDRFGGRAVFSVVMVCSLVPAVVLGFVDSYVGLLVCGFFVGLALASFSVGVGFVSGWYPPQKQGMALGIYGAGNAGQSLAAFGSPVIAAVLGYAWGFWVFSILTAIWAALFLVSARNAPRQAPRRTLAQLFEPLRAPMSWALSAYYFLTFGGFVAMSIYLPTFLTDL